MPLLSPDTSIIPHAITFTRHINLSYLMPLLSPDTSIIPHAITFTRHINHTSCHYFHPTHQSYLMPLLSPDTSISECEAAESEHINKFIKNIQLIHDPDLKGRLLLNDSLISSLKERQSYVVNCVSTFIFKCNEELQKFLSKTRIAKEDPKVTDIRDNLLRGNPQTINLP